MDSDNTATPSVLEINPEAQNNEIVSEVDTKIPPVPPAKRRKKLIIIIAIILLLVSAGIVGAYLLLNRQTSQPSPSPGPEASSTPDPTAGWQTYNNQSAQISFKYPPQLSEVLGEGGSYVAGPTTGKAGIVTGFEDESTVSPNTDAPYDGFTVYHQAVSDLKADPFYFDQYLESELNDVKQSPRGNPNATLSSQTIGDTKFYYIDTGNNVRPYYTISSDNTQIVVFSRIYKNNSFLATFDQILSTFKFTSDTSNWKTYTNKEYGFEIVFPSKLSNNSDVSVKENNSSVTLSASLNWGFTIYIKKMSLDKEISQIKEDSAGSNFSVEDLGIVKFNNYDSHQFEINTDMGKFKYILLVKGENIIEIQALEHIEKLDEILSTFKFTQ